MQSVSISQKLRPNKIAIIVPVDDSEALLKAIEVNTLFWGGRFNPIIPLYRKKINLKLGLQKKIYKPEEIIQHYIDLYDPDFILPINIDKLFLDKLNLGNRQQISLDEGFQSINFHKKDNYYRFGCHIKEVLNYFYENELKFERVDKANIEFAIPKTNNLFISSIFGFLSDEKQKEINIGKLSRVPNKITLNNYLKYMAHLTLNKLTRNYMQYYHKERPINKSYLFLMNKEKNEDIIEFWNLRAAGYDVLPVDISIKPNNKIVKLFIDDNFYPRGQRDDYNRTSITQSRNVTRKQYDDFTKGLDESVKAKCYFYTYYNPVWSFGDKLEIKCKDEFNNVLLIDDSNYLDFKPLKPDFYKGLIFGEHHFCNEVTIYSQIVNNQMVAKIFPSKNNMDLVSGIRINERRVLKKSIAVFVGSNDNIYLEVPNSEYVFIKWLKNQGWEAKTGSIAQLSKKVISFFEGDYAIGQLNNFSDFNLITLLQKLGNSELSEEEVLGKINYYMNKNPMAKSRYNGKRENVLKDLIKWNVLKLGIKVQCSVCRHHNWYSLDEIKYEIKCPTCTSDFILPTYHTKSLQYSYKAIGPFANKQNQNNGIYTPLLTLNFFDILKHHEGTTAIFNVEAKKGDLEIEFDLGIFADEYSYGRRDNQLTIFCECKTKNSFEQKDIDRMKILSKEFPECVLVFATQKNKLNKEEINLITPIFEEQKTKYLQGEPNSPILILTANELFLESEISYRYKWKKLTEKHKQFAENHNNDFNISGLAHETCELYLSD